MTTEIKHLVFKGIEKKEQILFKSFLNLAKNELEYQVVILKDNVNTLESANIVIADANYEFSPDEAALNKLPTILVGVEVSQVSGYIQRPVQWSDFKNQLTLLDIEAIPAPLTLTEQILPKNMEFAIVEMDDKPDEKTEESGDFSDADEYDFELDNLSIDYHSFTNSEYMKVVNDVKGFKQDGEENEVDESVEIPKALVLVTDEESAHSNSVLVIETNSLDAWEMSEADFGDEPPEVVSDGIESDTSYVDTKAESALSRKLKSGSVVASGQEFWSVDTEIYAGREQLMFIKPERNLVYSYSEPGKWVAALRKGPVTKLDIDSKWRPTSELKAFPISRLVWANTVATKNKDLAPGLDSQTDYILERWPHFDLLELDNKLLKLCTMLFVHAESPYSLIQKSGYTRAVVYGLVNACHELDILRASEEFDLEKFSEMNAHEGVFGKIKDVFRG